MSTEHIAYSLLKAMAHLPYVHIVPEMPIIGPARRTYTAFIIKAT